jgi:hypothetical protein
MKRNTLIAIVLCLMMITTAEVGAKSAKHDENPRQAGKSPIYFYDVEATDTHGIGQLVINMDKHTFVFIGKDFLPSAQMELLARAEGSLDHVVFAKGKATPSGNLHIAGTWEADDPPAGVLLDYQYIDGFWLLNQGLFVAKIAYRYSTDGGTTWKETDSSDGITAGNDRHVPYYNLGVPDNALVRLHVVVVWGDDKTATEVYRVINSACWGYYEIGGTTQNTKLYFGGTLCYE